MPRQSQIAGPQPSNHNGSFAASCGELLGGTSVESLLADGNETRQLNGIWLLFLLGRWSMAIGWVDLAKSLRSRNKKEFVSVDARYDLKKDTRAYEMLSRDSSAVVTPITPVKSPISSGRRTPDYFGQTARYQPPVRSFSSPRPPQSPPPPTWDARNTYARSNGFEDMNPLGMNRI
jgi:hypothetical protein